MPTGKFLSKAEGVQARKQHRQPCSDCPFLRDAVPGWLGGDEPGAFVGLAHLNSEMQCHVLLGAQCAGGAVYRANICKRVTLPLLTLPADKVKVFGNPMEFVEHHLRVKGKVTKAKVAKECREGMTAAMTRILAAPTVDDDGPDEDED